MQSTLVTTDMGLMGLGPTVGTLYYLAHGAWGVGKSDKNQAIPWYCGWAGWGGGHMKDRGIQTLTSDPQACSGFWSPPDILSPWQT